MKLKERLAFMALGGLLVFMGQPGCGGDDNQTKNETTEQTSTTQKSDESIDIELEKILNSLIMQLDDESAEVRRDAVIKLSKIGCPATIPGLIKGLGDPIKHVQDAAIDALVDIGEPAIPALERALAENNENAPHNATLALGRIGEASIPALIKALSVRNSRARVGAMGQLGVFGPAAKDAVPRLIQLLDAQGFSGIAASTLKKIGTPEAIKAVADFEKQ
jgi:HEAT repeat protein